MHGLRIYTIMSYKIDTSESPSEILVNLPVLEGYTWRLCLRASSKNVHVIVFRLFMLGNQHVDRTWN